MTSPDDQQRQHQNHARLNAIISSGKGKFDHLIQENGLQLEEMAMLSKKDGWLSDAAVTPQQCVEEMLSLLERQVNGRNVYKRDIEEALEKLGHGHK